MSTKPRTPQYFPKMKVRGARRRQLAPWQRTAGAIERMGTAFAVAASQIAQYAKTVNAFAAIDVEWAEPRHITIEEAARTQQERGTE